MPEITMQLRRMVLLTVLFIAASVPVACSDTVTDPAAAVASVAVLPRDGVWAGALRVGEAIDLVAKPFAADGTELPAAPVAWATSNESIAVVTQSGRLMALAAGEVHVRATIGGMVGQSFVTVTATPQEPVVTFVRVNPAAAVLQVGESRQYTVRVFDAYENEIFGREVVWSTPEAGTVEVSGTGLVTALAPGYADIVATVDGRTGTVGVTVATPEPVGAVIVTGTTAVFINQYGQLRSRVFRPTGGELPNAPVSWASETPDVAIVGAEGMVLGISKGTARIRATSGGVSGYFVLTVRDLPAYPVHSYTLAGTDQWRAPSIEIGQGTWTDGSGTDYPAYFLVTGGVRTIDTQHQRYTQSFTVEVRLIGGGPNAPAVETRLIAEAGDILYDFITAHPIYRPDGTTESRRAEYLVAGEYVVPQSVMGMPSQRWVWVLE